MRNYLEKIPESYQEKIKSRNCFRYWIGYFVRLKLHVKYATARILARSRGAKIGEGSILPWSLAWRCNSNLEVGIDTVIETSELDLRNKIVIGNHCIINKKVEIIRVSHYIDDDRQFSSRYYPSLLIGDYSWLATGCKILPSCCHISENTVIGAYSVVVKDTEEDGVYSGFPAKKLRNKNCRYDDLLVCSLMGGDFIYYRRLR